MANTTHFTMKKAHTTEAQTMGARAVVSKRKSLLMGASALTLLLGTPAVLVPMPAFAACTDNAPGNDASVVCDTSVPNPDTQGVVAPGATGVTVTVEEGAEIARTFAANSPGVSLGADAIVTVNGTITNPRTYAISVGANSMVTVGADGLVIADGGSNRAILVGGNSTVDIHGQVRAGETAGNFNTRAIYTQNSGVHITVRDGAEVVAAQGTAIEFWNTAGTVVVEEGGLVRSSNSGPAILSSGNTNSDVEMTVSGTVEGLEGAGGVGLTYNSKLTVTDSGVVRATGSSGFAAPAIDVGDEDNEIVINGTVETTGIAGAHGISVRDGRNEVTLGTSGSITTNENGSFGIRAVNGDQIMVIDGGIATQGDGAIGLYASGFYNEISVGSDSVIETQGAGSHGIQLASGGGNELLFAGEIITHDAGSIGIEMSGADDTDLRVSGTISGLGDAIRFGGGSNSLELRPGHAITGAVIGGTGADDMLVFGGTGSASFDVAALGAQYQGFEDFAVNYFFADPNFAPPIGWVPDIADYTDAVWTFTGDNHPFTATFDVYGGKAFANAGMTGVSFQVYSGATLGGNGTVGGVVIREHSILAPGSAGPGTAGTLIITGGLNLDGPDTVLDYDLGAVGASDFIEVYGHAELDGTVNINALPGFGNGVYTLMTYDDVVDNGLALGTTPTGYTYDLDIGGTTMTLTVAGGSAGGNQYWDGAGPAGNGTVEGGSGVWNASNANWTVADGSANAAWAGEFAIFGGTAGTVTVEGTQAFTGMQFLTNGYTIAAGTGGVLDADAAGATIRVGDGITATLDVQITGGAITKVEGGTLELTANEIVSPSATAETWTVEGGELRIDGGFVAGSWENDTAVIVRNGATLAVAEFGNIDANSFALGFTAVEVDGEGHIAIEENGVVAGTIEGTASDSTVTIAGLSYGGVHLRGSDNRIEVMSTGIVDTSTTGENGISLLGTGIYVGNSVVMDGRIKTIGSNANGISAGFESHITVGGVIETEGADSAGIIFGQIGDSNITVELAGAIATQGEGSQGIRLRGSGNRVTVSETGVVSTSHDDTGGTNPSAIMMYNGSGHFLEVAGTVSTTGAGAIAVQLHSDSSTMILSGTVAAASAIETAILFGNDFASTSSHSLELQPGYSITGLVIGDTSADFNDLVFGGDSGSATFDLSALGATEQFQNFNRFSKQGDATWTLTGTYAYSPAVTTPFYFEGGTLLVDGTLLLGTRLENSGVATLGGIGRIGTVQAASGLTIAPGGVTAGSEIGTLSIDVLSLQADTVLNFDLGTPGVVGGTDNDLIAVRYDLTLDGTLNVTDAGGFGNGEYTLIEYGQLLADNGLDIGTMPDSDLTYVVTAGTPLTGAGEVILTVSGGAAGNIEYWDGPNSASGVEGGDGVWNATNTNWTNQTGTVNDVWGGQFAIFSGTAGTVTVEGSQAFTGMQFRTSGYEIEAGAGGELVASLAQTNIRTGNGITATISAPITGTGGIVKQEAGTLVLAGTNTYAGATLVNGGILRAGAVNAFASGSAHTVAADAVLDLNGFDQMIGSLAGAGEVWIDTNAILTAGGNNTNTTFGGVMEGSGEFVKTGSGILTLTGENTLTGQVTIDQGTLSLGDGGVGGSIEGDIFNDNNFLVFNRSDDVIYDGVLSGTGATSFIGSGMTTLTGDSSGLTGQVFVTDGNLRIASGASLGASLLTVGADGTLSGFGSIAGNMSVEGRLAPGADTLGTLTVQGDVAFQTGSTYAIRIAGTNPDPSPAATIDSLMVGGTADLTGGAVEIAAIDPRTSYVDGHTYATPILSATGGLGGSEFAGVGMTSDSAFITPTLSYVGNDVFLTIAVTQDFTTAAETFNQFQAAGALNDLEQTGDALAVFNTIANMNADDARRAFDLTSGEVHAAGQHVIDQTFALFNRTLRYQGVAGVGSGNVGAQVFSAPLGYGPAVTASNAGVVAIEDAAAYADARVRGAWAAPLGGFGHIDGDGNAAQLDYWNAGLAGGYEGVIDVASGNAVGGFGFGYIHSRGTIDDRLSTFDADGFYLGAYGAWTDGPWNVAGSLSYGANRVSTERNIAFMGTTAEASYWTHTIGLSGEASYAFDLADTTRLAPLFTLDAGWSGHGGFTETGAGALNLTSGSESWTRLDAGLGLALTHTILTDSGKVTLEGRAVWEHAFSDVVPSQALALAGSPTGFTVLGPDAGRDRLRIGAGLSWDVSDDMTVRARYDGLFSGNQANHSASIGLNVRF